MKNSLKASDIACHLRKGMFSDRITLKNISETVLTDVEIVITYSGKERKVQLKRWRVNQSQEMSFVLAPTDNNFTVDIFSNEGDIGFQYSN